MSNLLKDFEVEAKNPSLEARQRWRSSVGLVKNRARRFRMISNLDKLAENEKKRCQIQVVPHDTDAIQYWIERVVVNPVDGEEGPADGCVIEFGGTIGDIEPHHENPPYIYLINAIFAFLLSIFCCKSVSSDMASRISNYSSSSPRFDADSCPSFSDGQTNSNLTPLPVSYPLRTAVSPGKVHQVFLSFRGEQLRYNFVSHLRDTLHRHEIKFFIDEYEQRGNDLKQLFVRIKESSIALAIFSTRYSESSWCMDELVKMKELSDQGKLRVIPIFFKVEADDVRKPTVDSEFGRNFLRLAEKSSVHQKKSGRKPYSLSPIRWGCLLEKTALNQIFCTRLLRKFRKLKKQLQSRKKRNHFGGKNEKEK